MIPKIIHYVFFNEENTVFTYVQYLPIITAIKVNKNQTKIHYEHMPSGKHTELLKTNPCITRIKAILAMHVNDKLIANSTNA